MADAVIENLITKLSFDFDDDQIDKFDDLLKSATKGLVAIVAGATAAATAIFAFTKKIAESNDELGKFAQRTGIDIKALQELGYVAELNGGSIDSMNSSLENLAKISSEAARGVGAGVEVFGMLGISVTDAQGRLKEADIILGDISDAISKLGSQAEKLEFAQKLGISSDLLLAIQEGSEAIRKQREEARELGFIIDQNAAKAAADFNDESLRMQKIISGIASAIGTRLMKQITPMINKLIDWFKINKTIIQQNLGAFLDKVVLTIRGVFNVVKRVVRVVLGLINAMGGLKNTIIAVTGVLFALNASALLMPILLIAAATAIFLLLEDIIKFAEGGDSAIGKLAERFPILNTLLRGTLKLLGLIRNGWTLIFTNGGEAIEGLIMLLKDIGRSITDFFLNPINKVISLIKKIPGFSSKEEPEEKTDFKFNNKEEPEEKIDFKFNNKEEPEEKTGFDPNMLTVSNEIINQERVPTSVQNQKSVSNNTVNKPTVNISINGGDTEKIKQAVTDVLNQQYSGAQTNLESQVDF